MSIIGMGNPLEPLSPRSGVHTFSNPHGAPSLELSAHDIPHTQQNVADVFLTLAGKLLQAPHQLRRQHVASVTAGPTREADAGRTSTAPGRVGVMGTPLGRRGGVTGVSGSSSMCPSIQAASRLVTSSRFAFKSC